MFFLLPPYLSLLQMAALYSELAAKQVQARIQKIVRPNVGKLDYDSDEDTVDGTWEHKVCDD